MHCETAAKAVGRHTDSDQAQRHYAVSGRQKTVYSVLIFQFIKEVTVRHSNNHHSTHRYSTNKFDPQDNQGVTKS